MQAKLKDWQVELHGFKQLADTGNYPGGDEIAHGLTLISPLLADKESRKFIERFNALKKDLLDLADRFQDLEHFYNHQRPTWERLRKAHAAFQLNRLELQKDAQAGPALVRMQEMLSAQSPYELIKEADNLISSVSAVNLSLLSERRAEVIAKIDGHIATLNEDLTTAQAEAGLRPACLEPLTAVLERAQKQDSLAHITQAESEALKEFDVAVGRIESVLTEQKKPKSDGLEESAKPAAVVKKQRIIKPTETGLKAGVSRNSGRC